MSDDIRLRGPVEIKLDKVRNLWFPLGVLRKISVAIESTPDQWKESTFADFGNLQNMLWFGLQWEDKELTFDRVGELVDVGNIEYVGKTVREAMSKQTNPTGGQEKNGEVAPASA